MHRALFALVLLSFGCAGDDTQPTVHGTPCSRLRDHLVELRLDGVTGTPDEMEQHRAAMIQALGNDFLASCQTSMTSSQIACATGALDLTAASDCSDATGH